MFSCSLTEMNFLSQSDVGHLVLSREIFSFGKSPNPGIMDYDQLVGWLINGNRMKWPEYISNQIGQLMDDCWKAEPTGRPTFRQLEETFGQHLDTSVRSYYN